MSPWHFVCCLNQSIKSLAFRCSSPMTWFSGPAWSVPCDLWPCFYFTPLEAFGWCMGTASRAECGDETGFHGCDSLCITGCNGDHHSSAPQCYFNLNLCTFWSSVHAIYTVLKPASSPLAADANYQRTKLVIKLGIEIGALWCFLVWSCLLKTVPGIFILSDLYFVELIRACWDLLGVCVHVVRLVWCCVVDVVRWGKPLVGLTNFFSFSPSKRPAPPDKPLPPDPVQANSQVSQDQKPSVRLTLYRHLKTFHGWWCEVTSFTPVLTLTLVSMVEVFCVPSIRLTLNRHLKTSNAGRVSHAKCNILRVSHTSMVSMVKVFCVPFQNPAPPKPPVPKKPLPVNPPSFPAGAPGHPPGLATGGASIAPSTHGLRVPSAGVVPTRYGVLDLTTTVCVYGCACMCVLVCVRVWVCGFRVYVWVCGFRVYVWVCLHIFQLYFNPISPPLSVLRRHPPLPPTRAPQPRKPYFLASPV